MSNLATRLLNLIMMLQQKPNQKASELAAELKVSVRTLHRYIAMLEEMGLPIVSERGRDGGFSLIHGYRMLPLVFSPQEAVALALGGSLVQEVWGDLLAEETHSALIKLTNVLPNKQLQEIKEAQKSMMVSGLNRSTPGSLDPFLQALRQGSQQLRQVEISYRSRKKRTTQTRIIEPYGLIYRWGWWYVVGYCQLRQEIRSFRVDRMEAAYLLNQRFVKPVNFDLNVYLANEAYFQSGMKVILRFLPEWVHIAYDNRYDWETMVTQSDGSLLVTFTSPDIHWAGNTALSYGALVEVMEPAELRTYVAKQVRILAKRYKTEIQHETRR